MVTKQVSKKAVEKEVEQLRNYEMVFIISPEVTDEKLDAAIDKISRSIAEKGGVVAEVEQWGKRKLAYPIKNFGDGNYVLARFTLKNTLCKELEANIQISEDILRHLLIKTE